VLLTHPRIRLAAVTAVPDEIRGEEVKACYVLSDGTTEVRPDELAAFCAERLAAFKVPRYWQPAADLPRTDSERVIKERLGELTGPVFDRVDGRWAGSNPQGRSGC
jgi:crotonobetaine/carnitine-CoA ligase